MIQTSLHSSTHASCRPKTHDPFGFPCSRHSLGVRYLSTIALPTPSVSAGSHRSPWPTRHWTQAQGPIALDLPCLDQSFCCQSCVQLRDVFRLSSFPLPKCLPPAGPSCLPKRSRHLPWWASCRWRQKCFLLLRSILRALIAPLTVSHHVPDVLSGAVGKLSSQALHTLRDRGVRSAISTEQLTLDRVCYTFVFLDRGGGFLVGTCSEGILFTSVACVAIQSPDDRALRSSPVPSGGSLRRGPSHHDALVSFAAERLLATVLLPRFHPSFSPKKAHNCCPVLSLRKKMKLRFILHVSACSSNGRLASGHTLTLELHHQDSLLR